MSFLLCQRIEDEAIALGCSQDAFPCDLRKQIAMGTRLLKTCPEGFRAFLEFDAFSRRAGLQSTKCFFFETWCSIDFWVKKGGVFFSQAGLWAMMRSFTTCVLATDMLITSDKRHFVTLLHAF